MENVSAIEYRLSVIEQTLTELKNVILKTALQQKDIDDLKRKEEEFLNAVNSHDKRIKVLELQPLQEKSNRWQFIVDTVFKLFVTGMGCYLLTKIGLPT